MTPWSAVSAKKRQLDALRTAVPAGHLDALERHQRIDITYTSNALEGNTLTAGETALVLEKGITVSGKPLKDHLEAIDHARAFDWIVEIARQGDRGLSEADLRTLHGLVVANSASEIAGRYADSPRFVNTNRGLHEFPAPMEVPGLMRDFCAWLRAAEPAPATAFQAHRRLVAIHPFNDGNGRTARLLMNLLLVCDGYPPIAIRPDDRPAYLSALEQAQGGGGEEAFDALMLRRLDQTLDLYIGAARQTAPRSDKIVPLRK